MFWNASLRTVTHFRRCSQTSLLCTRRHANRSLTAERRRSAELIGAWKRAVAHDVEVTTLTECYVYGSVLGNGWLRGWVGSEVRNVCCANPRAHDTALVFFIATFFLQTDFQKKALSFSCAAPRLCLQPLASASAAERSTLRSSCSSPCPPRDSILSCNRACLAWFRCFQTLKGAEATAFLQYFMVVMHFWLTFRSASTSTKGHLGRPQRRPF